MNVNVPRSKFGSSKLNIAAEIDAFVVKNFLGCNNPHSDGQCPSVSNDWKINSIFCPSLPFLPISWRYNTRWKNIVFPFEMILHITSDIFVALTFNKMWYIYISEIFIILIFLSSKILLLNTQYILKPRFIKTYSVFTDFFYDRYIDKKKILYKSAICFF